MNNKDIPLTDQWLERFATDPPAEVTPTQIKILACEIILLRRQLYVQRDTILQMQNEGK